MLWGVRNVLQIGDVFAVLIEFYFSMGNMEKCYQVSLSEHRFNHCP